MARSTVVETAQQRLLVDERTARNIYEQRIGFESSEKRFVDQRFGRLARRTSQHHHVCLRQMRSDVIKRDDSICVLIANARASNNGGVTAECLGTRRDISANVSVADDEPA